MGFEQLCERGLFCSKNIFLFCIFATHKWEPDAENHDSGLTCPSADYTLHDAGLTCPSADYSLYDPGLPWGGETADMPQWPSNTAFLRHGHQGAHSGVKHHAQGIANQTGQLQLQQWTAT